MNEIEVIQPPQLESAIFLFYDPVTDKVLLERRQAKFEGDKMVGLVIIPGGKVDVEDRAKEGDYFEHALVREIDEEFGVELRDYSLLFEVNHVTLNNEAYRSKIYLVIEWEGKITNRENKHEYSWIPLNEAEDVCTHWLGKEIIKGLKTRLSG